MPKKILIIDDEIDMLKVTVGRLEKTGYSVIQATGGQMGLDLLETEKPDLILLDLVMPGVDGYEVCRKVKQNDITKNIPVILFAATIAFKPLNKKIEELHADDYVPKPFDSKILIEKIKKFIG